MVEVEPKEVEEPNEACADLVGDFGWPGSRFWSLTTPLVGERGLLVICRLGLSCAVLTVRCGGCPMTGAPAWSNLFAMFLTDPAGLEGRRCGVDFALFKVWFAWPPVPSCWRIGDLDAERAAVSPAS